MKQEKSLHQLLPIILTILLLAFLAYILHAEINILNLFISEKISKLIRYSDILVGMTIYLKTSIDFAIFMGNLMKSNPGWKNRIAIEIGTGIGNAFGTMTVLGIWSIFKEINFLLSLMVIIASLVLFRLAQEGIHHILETKLSPVNLFKVAVVLDRILDRINLYTKPVLKFLIPNISMSSFKSSSFYDLFKYSFTIPFILGLDDFAGYVPLFSIVNVFGFGLGVMAGHTILNILLFMSAGKTVRTIKNPYISFLGSIAFIILALWGLKEGLHLLFLN